MILINTQEVLEKLGFTKHEAAVYLALLEVGPCSSAPIIKKTSLHRNIVYETLDRLVAKKFVAQTKKAGKLHFSVLDPVNILRAEQERLVQAERLVPVLQAQLQKDQQQVVIYEGVEEHLWLGLEKIKTMQEGGTVYIMGAGGEWYDRVGDDYIKKYDEVRKKRKISLKIIFYREEYSLAGEKTAMKRPMIEIAVLNEIAWSPASTTVIDDCVIIDTWGDAINTIEIRGKKIAQAYLEYFNLMWILAQKR